MKPVASVPMMNHWLKTPLYGLVAFASFQVFMVTSDHAVKAVTTFIKSTSGIGAPELITFCYPFFIVYLLSFIYDQFSEQDQRSLLHGFFASALLANPFMMGHLMSNSHLLMHILPSAYVFALIEVLFTMFALRVTNIPNTKMQPLFGIITAVFVAAAGLSSVHYHMQRHTPATLQTTPQISAMDTLQDQAYDAQEKLSDFGAELSPQSCILLMLTLSFGVLIISQIRSDTGHSEKSVIAKSVLDKRYEKLRHRLREKSGNLDIASLVNFYGTDAQSIESDGEPAHGARKLARAANLFKSRKGRIVQDFARNFPPPDPQQKHLG